MEVARSATTILFIDAHKADREYWKQHLTSASPDYVVLEAATGAEGLAICESQRIDCVITEFTLPGMSGFEVLAHLRHEALILHPLAGRLIGYRRGVHRGSQITCCFQEPDVCPFHPTSFRRRCA